MIGKNILTLRKIRGLTQEELAEQVGVSRQAVTKWENGESVPDLASSCALAELFRVSLDDLVRFDDQDTGLMIPPRGKHFFGSLTVGPEGQLYLPEKARTLFGIHTGDQLLLLGDEGRGLALLHQRDLIRFAEAAGIFPPDDQS